MNKYTAQTYKNINNTIYVYNLDEKVTDEILFELFLQCGPVKYVFLPNDRLTKVHLGYAFVEFNKAEDAEYAINIMSNIKLYNRPLRITKAAEDKNSFLTGANLFVRNVGDDVNEKSLQALFSHYGTVLSVQIMRDATTGKSRGYAFVNFDSFQSADEAILNLNGQYVNGRPIEVEYAYKEGKPGERHGTEAERRLHMMKTEVEKGEN